MNAVLKIVSTPTQDSDSANVSGSEAQGAALAEQILRWEGEAAQKGKRFLRNISDLDNPGRMVLRTTLRDYLDAFRLEARQWKGTEKEALFKSRNAVLSARVSEYSRFSEACDCGWHPDDWDAEYAEILAAARCLLNGTADMASGDVIGPTRLRGRKPTSKAEKFVKYLEKMEPTLSDLEEFGKIIRLTIKAAKDEAAAEATEAASEAAEQAQAA